MVLVVCILIVNMAHLALIDDDGTVLNVVRIPDEEEHRGQDYMNYDLFIPGRWLVTSYNTYANVHRQGKTPFRGNYATIGGKYLEDLDVFIDKQPYPSWVLNYTTYQWEAPVPHPPALMPPDMTPTDVPGRLIGRSCEWYWNEEILNWDLTCTEKIFDVPLD